MNLKGILFLDESMPAEEVIIFQNGTDPLTEGWVPCKHPERPLNRQAAIKHYIRGEPCRACEIAQDAFFKSNRRHSYGVETD